MREQTAIIPTVVKYNVTADRLPKSSLMEGLLLISGILAGAYIHYQTPDIISIALQVIVLALFFRSNTNYPWLFILFFVTFKPGSMFSNQAKPLILFSNASLGVVTFQMMFILVSWIKVLKQKAIPVFFQRRFLFIPLYILILALVFGARPVYFIRSMMFLSWLLVIPRLLHEQKEFDRLFYLIFLANIFAFLANLYRVTTAHQILEFFTAIASARRFLDPDSLIRTAEAIQFAHLSVIGGLFYLSKEHSPISPALAYSGLVIGLMNIISSATRGWIISSVFMIIAYSFFMLPRLFRNIVIVIPVVVITVGIIWQVPIIRNQMIKAYERTLYFENILRPDFDEDTTDIGRVIRGARVLDKFRESPIIGVGIGKNAEGYTDSHTGNQSILLNFGIIGYLLLLNLWGWFIYKLLSTDRIIRPRNPEFKLHVLTVLSFVSVFFIHSTSGAFLHPTIGYYATPWYGLIFALGNYLYYKDKGIFT